MVDCSFSISRSPVVNVAIFAFLLNYPWEFIQAPLFAGMADARHLDAIKACTRATLGDAVIMSIAYALIATLTSNRRWILEPLRWHLVLFTAAGVAIAVVIERLALAGRWPGAWSYAAEMPVVPVIGVGMAPLLQWLLLPSLVAWFVRRQLASAGS